jgi:replicative DNA helicase
VLNIATNIAKRKKKAVAIFNLEMAADQLVQRIISSEALVDSQKLRQGNLNTDDWEKIANATSELSETDILIDANPSITVTSMKAKLRRIKNLGLVVVDYLQLMQSERKNDPSRVNQVGEISRGLKIMAKELQVPVIVCAQLSRSTEKEHKKPMLSDLRESGSIEQDADMVIFLSRDYYGEDPDKANLVEVIIAKNRHGETGTVEMSWLGQYTKFSCLSTDLREE